MSESTFHKVFTASFIGMSAKLVEVQVQVMRGMPSFLIVGLAGKAVAESKERVRSALSSMGLGLPSKRIVVNLAPADLPKDGSHYDLPIALGLLKALDILKAPTEDYLALGELSLGGTIVPTAGVLAAAMSAMEHSKSLLCPAACAQEALWSGLPKMGGHILPAGSLLEIINHFKGTQTLERPSVLTFSPKSVSKGPDLRDIRGHADAKRALEVVASGGHNLMMIGPPGVGKSMLARALPSILPPLDMPEILEVSLVLSLTGMLSEKTVSNEAPFRAPHHSASTAALIGGGKKAQPGEVSLAHRGVLFLDELPEFPRAVIDSLRQPIETGEVTVARAQMHATYPARFQLVAAMNPCRCGYAQDPQRACGRLPVCAKDYQDRISGPLWDRFDVVLPIKPLSASDRAQEEREASAAVAERVAHARVLQRQRHTRLVQEGLVPETQSFLNAHLEGASLEQVIKLAPSAKELLARVSDKFALSMRAYHRIMRLAQTLADLEACEAVSRAHVAEAVSYRFPVQSTCEPTGSSPPSFLGGKHMEI